VRRQLIPLWEEVAEYNKEHRPEETYSVTFYCGQNLTEESE